MTLQRIDKDLWAKPVQHSFLGLHVGSRMTVVRLPSGETWIHSPTAFSEEAAAEIEAIGRVGFVVAPNLYHHVYVKPWTERFPKAALVGPRKLQQKRKDLTLNVLLDPQVEVPWRDALPAVEVAGCMLGETVFLHEPTRTLIATDLLENFDSSPHFFTRIYLRLAGIEHGPGFSRALRPLVRDRAKFQASLDLILALDFDRMIVAHGAIIESDAKSAIRSAFSWLAT